MALFGSAATVRVQASPTQVFATAFSYLDDVFAERSAAAARISRITLGETHRVELGGGVFALEQAYRSKARPDGFFESHRNYIDLQVVVEGEEWMEVIDLQRALVREDYDPQRDLVVYRDSQGSKLRIGKGDAAVFYPADVHMPGLCGAAGPELVRKTVVKIPVQRTG